MPGETRKRGQYPYACTENETGKTHPLTRTPREPHLRMHVAGERETSVLRFRMMYAGKRAEHVWRVDTFNVELRRPACTSWLPRTRRMRTLACSSRHAAISPITDACRPLRA